MPATGSDRALFTNVIASHRGPAREWYDAAIGPPPLFRENPIDDYRRAGQAFPPWPAPGAFPVPNS